MTAFVKYQEGEDNFKNYLLDLKEKNKEELKNEYEIPKGLMKTQRVENSIQQLEGVK